MTRLFAFLVCLSSVLSHGQTVPSRATHAGETVQSALLQPETLTDGGSSTKVRADAPLRVSTVRVPKLIHRVEIKDNGRKHFFVSACKREVVVEFEVGTNGVPTSLQVIAPENEDLDEQILAAVGQYRFQPGLLDGKPEAMQVRLHYIVVPGTSY